MKTSDVFKFQALGWACIVAGLVTGSTAFGAPSQANGTADIGGGTGVVCRDSKGDITSAHLLDLYEGSVVDGLQIPDVDVPNDTQVAMALDRLAFGFPDHLELSPKIAMAQLRDVLDNAPPGTFIDMPDDLGNERSIFLPRGCKREAIGQREKPYGRTRLVVVPEVFEKLSKTHQAAFLVHEAIYSFYIRQFNKGVTRGRGTIDVRKLTAALFAANTGLAEIATKANFLFQDKIHVDERRAGARVTLEGRSSPLDIHLDELSPRSASGFYCNEGGSIRISSSTVDPTRPRNWKLQLNETNACLSRVVIRDLRAILQVNGRDILEVAGGTELEIVFLKDHPHYQEFSRRARYPYAARPAGRE